MTDAFSASLQAEYAAPERHRQAAADLGDGIQTVAVDLRRRNDDLGNPVLPDQRLELIATAEYRQPVDAGGMLAPVVVHESDGHPLERAIVQQLADDQLAAGARPVDQHLREGGRPAPEDLAEEAKRESASTDQHEQQQGVQQEHRARVTDEALGVDEEHHARHGPDRRGLGDANHVGDARELPDAAIETEAGEDDELDRQHGRERPVEVTEVKRQRILEANHVGGVVRERDQAGVEQQGEHLALVLEVGEQAYDRPAFWPLERV